MPDLPCTMHENLLGEIKEAKVNEGPHPTSLRSATFPIGEGKAVERLRSKPAFPFGEGARRADEVFVRLSPLKLLCPSALSYEKGAASPNELF